MEHSQDDRLRRNFDMAIKSQKSGKVSDSKWPSPG